MVIMKNAIFVKFGLIGLIMLPISAFADKLIFQGVYQYSMTDGRSQTLQLCDAGRRWNNLGISYWSIELVEQRKSNMLNMVRGKRISMNDVNAYQSGTASAMNRLCPNVW